jgi:hypothetical protein
MKTKTIFISFIIILFLSCKEKKPFKPALESILIELKDSLKTEVDNKKILAIEFNSDKHFRNADFKIFTSDSYSSVYIDGFVKFKGVTIAIYNLNDDYYELVNKNDITFFTDTIIGFGDNIGYSKPKKQFLYFVKNDSIVKVSGSNDFPGYPALRMPKYGRKILYTEPVDTYFQYDSIKAEREVEYYRVIGEKIKGKYPPQYHNVAP